VARVLLAVYVLVCLLALTWPGAQWAGSRIEPFVLGLPFSLAWYGGWSVATFLVLALYHRVTRGGEE
jgi:hypothetical protein